MKPAPDDSDVLRAAPDHKLGERSTRTGHTGDWSEHWKREDNREDAIKLPGAPRPDVDPMPESE